jgi:hypothetical protein
MSYLDDSDHTWELEPIPSKGMEEELWFYTLQDMVEDLAYRKLDEEALQIILRGYAGLKERHPEAPDQQCLHTSMVWYFG